MRLSVIPEVGRILSVHRRSSELMHGALLSLRQGRRRAIAQRSSVFDLEGDGAPPWPATRVEPGPRVGSRTGPAHAARATTCPISGAGRTRASSRTPGCRDPKNSGGDRRACADGSGDRAYVTLPMAVEGALVGVLTHARPREPEFVRRRRPRRSPSEVADQLAIAIQQCAAARSSSRGTPRSWKRQRATSRTRGTARRSTTQLDAFAYSVSHDLRAPLRAMEGFSQALLEDYGDAPRRRGSRRRRHAWSRAAAQDGPADPRPPRVQPAEPRRSSHCVPVELASGRRRGDRAGPGRRRGAGAATWRRATDARGARPPRRRWCRSWSTSSRTQCKFVAEGSTAARAGVGAEPRGDVVRLWRGGRRHRHRARSSTTGSSG